MPFSLFPWLPVVLQKIKMEGKEIVQIDFEDFWGRPGATETSVLFNRKAF